MADASWDNGGYGQPTKVGMPMWAKVLLGCGVAAVLALATCVGGGVYLAHRIKQDPKGFKTQVMSFAIDRMRPEWEDFRAVVTQLRTPEGCRALYAASPDLATTWPTEADFLAAARGWQPTLVAPPELTTDVLEHGGLQISSEFGGRTRVAWRPKGGARVAVTFDRSRKAGDAAPRRVIAVEVQPGTN